jgi:hypothetical protein
VRVLATMTVLLCVAALWAAAVVRDSAAPVAPRVVQIPPPHRARPRPQPAPARPPQFVVASFDGAGGWKMWSYWLAVGRRAHAHFTFFVSGAYLVDWAHRTLYLPPRHEPGTSAIGFARPTGDITVAGTRRGIDLGYREGHEIGTHFVGHFCSPFAGSVGEWTAADWAQELDQFDALFIHADPKPRFPMTEIAGARTPCLEGNLGVLDPVLARHGFRYDASRVAPLGSWPRRTRGLWSFPLPELPFIGHTFRVISMDYNFFANQTGLSPRQAERQAYRTLWNAFAASYLGKRAPFSIGQHFETWGAWAYDHALARFLVAACRLPEVRCASYRELADFLDSLPRAQLRRYRAGRFRDAAARMLVNRT